MGRARSSWRGKGRLEGGGAQGEGMGELPRPKTALRYGQAPSKWVLPLATLGH